MVALAQSVGGDERAERNDAYQSKELGRPPHEHQVEVSLQTTALPHLSRRDRNQLGQPPKIAQLIRCFLLLVFV